ncbi:hypothetical protein V5799_026290 [Amblyomma americanum]|uniref:ABC-2 type transporter transmembrane domain-containing protein n=1 Tax=Amblyomma americanum TaxID=6943 RepID=A0AAQ4DJ01_AMBAM
MDTGSEAVDVARASVSNAFLSFKQLYVILWKNVYVKRLCRHYFTTLLEIALITALLLGIQENSVVREPLIRRGPTFYLPIHTNAYWNTQPDLATIRQVYYFPPRNKYLSRLTHETFSTLRVTKVVEVPTLKQLSQIQAEIIRHSANGTKPARSVALFYTNVGVNDTDAQPVSLHVSFFAGSLPFDVQVNFRQRLISQPEGPVAEERFPEMHTLLPIMGALQQRHLELQAERFRYPHPLEKVRLQRFPFPPYIEHHDQKNYALVLTRFCIGMLIPFSLFVAKLTDEKATGIKEMLRVAGVNDWVYWVSHYLSAFFMHLIIVTLMLLFLCVKRNEEGRAFVQFSDPALLFVILMFFCSQCMVHAMCLSLFFANPHSAVAGAMLYWTFSCVMPFLFLEHAGGQGYYYIAREHKLLTAIFPGMSLHWSFRVLERFEKFGGDPGRAHHQHGHGRTPRVADVLGDRVAILANGGIRCCGSPTFLKQRFSTGYRMQINKLPNCNVPAIAKLLRKYASKARVQSDSLNEAVFLLGQIIATKVIIAMFKDIEKHTDELGIESVGVSVTSLEDVLIRVGEDQHVHRQQRKLPEGVDEDATVMEAKAPLVKVVASSTCSDASLTERVRAVFAKRTIHAYRERRMPLFSWVLPPCLLTLLFIVELWGLSGSSRELQNVDDTLRYTFPKVLEFSVGFELGDTETQFRERYLVPMFSDRRQYYFKRVQGTADVGERLLEYAKLKLFIYVFNTHFGFQMTKATG